MKYISVQEKKSFLTHFLESYNLKRTEARYIIQYLLQNNHLLRNVHFTNKGQKDKVWLNISTTTSSEDGLLFYNKGKKTESLANIMATISTCLSNPIYLTLHFNGSQQNFRYIQLLENRELENIKTNEKWMKDSNEVNELLNSSLSENKEKLLKMQIDQALELNDKKRFTELVEELKKIKSKSL